jgi:hypothetical protein
MAQMFEQFKFSVRTLRQDGRAEWFHNLLDCHGLASKLVLCRATCHFVKFVSFTYETTSLLTIPDRRRPYQPVGGRYI